MQQEKPGGSHLTCCCGLAGFETFLLSKRSFSRSTSSPLLRLMLFPSSRIKPAEERWWFSGSAIPALIAHTQARLMPCRLACRGIVPPGGAYDPTVGLLQAQPQQRRDTTLCGPGPLQVNSQTNRCMYPHCCVEQPFRMALPYTAFTSSLQSPTGHE